MIGIVVTVVSTVVADELEVVEIFFFLGRLLITSLFLASAAVVVVEVDAPFSKHLTTLPFSSTHPTKNVDFLPLYERWTMPLLFVVLFSRDDNDDTEMGGLVMVAADVVLVFASLLTGVKNAEELVDKGFSPLLL